MKMKVLANIKNILILLSVSLVYLIPRVVGLGFDVINIDYPLWDNRATNFFIYLKTFNFVETYRTSHPGVTLMWLGGGAIEVFSRVYTQFFHIAPVINEYSIFPWRSLFIKLTLVFAILFLYLLAVFLITKIFNKKVALLFFVLVSLEPCIIAHDRIFHLEGLLTALIFVSCLFSIYFWKNLEFRYLLFSAIFSALSFLTKVTGIFSFSFFFLTSLIMSSPRDKKFFIRGAIFSFSFLLFVVIFFPAMWVSPIDTLSKMLYGALSMSETGHSQYFLGSWTDNPGILFYPIVFLFKSSPILIIWLLVFVIVSLWKRGVLKRTDKFLSLKLKETILLLFFILFYLAEVSLFSKKVPRYILPIYPPLLLLMSLSLISVYKKLKNRAKKYAIALFSLGIFISFVLLYKTYPNFLAYTNPILGGMKTADYFVGNKHFGFGLKAVAEYMNKKPYIEGIKLIFDGDGTIGPFYLGMARNATYIYRDHISTADYFLLPYYLLDTDPMYLEYKKDFVLEKVFNVNGYPYWYLFRNVRIN
ncbi:MAG: glycosyltransferase family 39 protein [Patescibacteria group bacterium]